MTNKRIANGTMSADTLIKFENELGPIAQVQVLDEMNRHDVNHYHLAQDKGNRKGRDCLVKVMSYPFMDGDLRNFCWDMDPCGKTARQHAEGINDTVSFIGRYSGAQCSSLTGDSGGGGNMTSVARECYALGALDEEVSRYCRCLQHGLNNAFSNAIIESVGNQGLGHDTCLQMVFGLIKMLRTIIKDYGMSVYDGYYKIVMEKLRDDDNYFSECMDKFEPDAQALLDEMMSEDLDEVADLFDKGMRGTMLSVLTRWQTAIPGIKLVVEKYPILYTFANTLIAKEKSGTSLHSIAIDAAKLMNIYPVDSKTPVLLTQLKFI